MNIFTEFDKYEVFTPIIGVFSLFFLTIFVTYLVTAYSITKKFTFKVADCICILILLVGIYINIPYLLFQIGQNKVNTDLIEIAEKISINPYEKRLCNSYLGYIYGIYCCHVHDGNKAIKHYEKAIGKKYSENKKESDSLAFLYALNGDTDKIDEMSKSYPQCKLYLYIPYIMNGEYKKALEMLEQYSSNTVYFCYLKAALYKELGDKEIYEKTLKVADDLNESYINKRFKKYEKIYEDDVNSFKSISARKEECEKLRKEYFGN